MEITDHLPTTETTLTRPIYLVVLVSTLLGAAHHIDHIIRGNHLGWPITPEVNPFTFSLAIYPLLAISLYLTLTRRAGAGYWAAFFAFSASMLAYFHISPWAVEPPQDVMVPYTNPIAGYLAFGIILALIGSVAIGAIYGALQWYGNRDTAKPSTKPD